MTTHTTHKQSLTRNSVVMVDQPHCSGEIECGLVDVTAEGLDQRRGGGGDLGEGREIEKLIKYTENLNLEFQVQLQHIIKTK